LNIGRIVETYVATGEVTALEHELRDHAVELGARVSKALLTSAEGTEVLSGLGDDIVVEGEVDAAGLVYEEISDGSKQLVPIGCISGNVG